MMKILWVTNTIFPELSRALGKSVPVVGGWMYGLADDLTKRGVSLNVATARPKMKSHKCTIEGTNYFLLHGEKPITDYDKTLEEQWKKLIEEVSPDIVHIHGTEYAHGLALMKACPNLRYVISIQGMTSIISRYYYAGITLKEIIKNITFRDILKGDGIVSSKKQFKSRGEKIEMNYLKLANDIVGRTEWDHDHIKTVNPNANYHFCDESLRDNFYTSRKWDIASKNDYSLFLSQASYPIKGLHKVLEAMHLLKDEFPTIKVRVAGNDILKNKNGIKEKLKLKGYGKYIGSLIKKYNLQGSVEFTGFLEEEDMIQEYLNSHIFVSPSSIENGSNSIGEGQILGVPCIASYVGGVPNTVTHHETGLLYRFEEVEMLAQSIKRIFENETLAKKLSKNGIEVASARHNRKNNTDQMLSIYHKIMQTETNP